MLQNNNFSESLLKCFDWHKATSKNPIMYSYIKENMRMNHYFTTGTVTIQDDAGNIKTWRGIDTDEKIEEIICKQNPLD